MSKFILTASKSTPKEGQLIYHATMSVAEFIANGYANANGVNIVVNPQGNNHPKGWFLSWKDKEGVQFSGSVAKKITTPEEAVANTVVSVVSTPEKADELFVLLHTQGEAPADSSVLNLK